MKLIEPYKTELVAALRSGAYEQIDGQLRRFDPDDRTEVMGYCCLGVLCDLHAQKTGNTWDGINYLDGETLLPESVASETMVLEDADRKIAEFRDDPDFHLAGALNEDQRRAAITMFHFLGRDDDVTCLTRMNDSGLKFTQIADFIEAHC